MSGYERNQRRIQQLNGLGRNLARRSSSSCEICEQSGQALKPYEVLPLFDEPTIERTILVCGACRKAIEGGPMNPDEWRSLSGPIWSDVAPVQVTAIRLMRRLAEAGIQWAKDELESVYLEPNIQAWVESG